MSTQHSAFSTFCSPERGILCTVDYKPLSLHGCTIDIDVKGCGAAVRLHMEYINESNKDQRVIAAYPLPTGWGLRHCRLQYDGAEVNTRYTRTAVSASCESASALNSAATPDKMVWTVAAQRVPFVITVGMSVVMTATYEVPLPSTHTAGQFQLDLPPQLIPTTKRPHKASLEYNMLFQVPLRRLLRGGLTLRAQGRLFFPLRSTISLCHGSEAVYAEAPIILPAEVTYEGDTGFRLTYSAALDTTFQTGLRLRGSVLNTTEPVRMFLEKDVGTVVPDDMKQAVLTFFTPDISSSDTNAELILVVDSHTVGTSVAVGQALRLALRSLPDTVRINVVVLKDEGATCVFAEGCRAIREVPLAAVSALVAELTPQRPTRGDGFTRLPQVMHGLLSRSGTYGAGPTPRGYCRQVVVVSDEAGTTDLKGAAAMVGEVFRACSHARVSCVAVDHPQTAGGLVLLHELALQGGGVYEQVSDLAALPEALVQVLAATVVPTLTDVRVHFHEAGVLASGGRGPQPAVPQGSQCMLYALAPLRETFLTVTITGWLGDAFAEYRGTCDTATQAELQCEQQDDATDPEGTTSGVIHVNAAAARMRYLMEENDTAAPSPDDVREAVRLSEIFALPSPYTQMTQACVGAPAAPPASREVVQVAATYMPRARTFAAQLVNRCEAILARQALRPIRKRPAELTPSFPPVVGPINDFLNAIVRAVVEDVLADPHVDRLVPLQYPDGSFAAGQSVACCLGIPVTSLTLNVPESCPSANAWATVVAVVAMEATGSRLTALSERAARRYLGAQVGTAWHDWEGDAKAALTQLAA